MLKLLRSGFQLHQKLRRSRPMLFAIVSIIFAVIQWGVLPFCQADVVAVAHEAKADLVASVRKGNMAAVKAALKRGADPNSRDDRGWYVLQWAVFTHNNQIVNELLAAGAKVDVHDPNVSSGETPLHLAIHCGDKSLVQLLVDKGANIHQVTESGITPLYAASSLGHIDVIEVLLKAGAGVNTPMARTGMTALHAAALHGQKGVLMCFSARGLMSTQRIIAVAPLFIMRFYIGDLKQLRKLPNVMGL